MFIAILLVVGLAGGAAYVFLNADQMQFESVCNKKHKRFTKLCNNIGKYAWTQQSVLQINELNYGKILGVAWRKKGSIISSSKQKNKRRSESNSYYYIVGDNKNADSQFLRIVSQVDPRDSKTKSKK